MDLLNEQLGFTDIPELPRELRTNELLGRRVFVEINKIAQSIHTVGEVLDWTAYSLDLAKIKISFANCPYLNTIDYVYNHTTNLLTFTFHEECSFVEGRTLTRHIQKEIRKWQKKRKLKR